MIIYLGKNIILNYSNKIYFTIAIQFLKLKTFRKRKKFRFVL